MEPSRLHRSIVSLSAASLLSAVAAAQGGFVERAQELGLLHQHLAGYDLIGHGIAMQDWIQSGVALGDLDGDGDLDVVACGGVRANHVFRNDGAGFTDMTALAGIETHEFDRVPALGDFDRDGDLDLFLGAVDAGNGARPGHSRLYRNGGGFRFTDVTALAGTVGAGHSAHARWADVDLDGLLDLYVGEFHGTRNELYVNQGDGTFRNMASVLGGADFGSAHVVAVVDVDDDGWLDLLTGNDWAISAGQALTNNAPDGQHQGQPNGTFTNVASGAGFLGLTTMGMAFGDVNYDGLLDVYKTEYGENYLLVNNGWPASGIPWSNEELFYRVQNASLPDTVINGHPGWAVGWGTTFAHFDHDPWLDLFVVNGHVVGGDPRGQRNFLFRGLGPAFEHRFGDATEEYGLLDRVDERGLSVGDVDRDGDLDLFIAPTAGPLRFFENQLERAGNGGLLVRAVTRTSAPGGHGVRVEWADSTGHLHVRVIGSESPAASQNAHEAFFGLGTEASADVRVQFPSGVTRAFPGVPADTMLVAEEPLLVELESRNARVADAGQPFTVTAHAHDPAGDPLGAGAGVTIELEGLAALSDVEHVAGSTFRRTFALPANPGEHRATVAFDGFEVRIKPRLRVVGRATAAESVVRLTPECARAASTDALRVEAVPKDLRGLALGAGHAVSVRFGGGAPIALADRGDGSYAGAVAAPLQPAHYVVELIVDGIVHEGVGVAEIAGPPIPGLTSVYREVPDPNIAASPNQLRLLVTPRDNQGLRLGPRAQLEVLVTEDPGTAPVNVLDGDRRGAQRDGDYFVILARAPGSAADSAAGTFRVLVDGVEVALGGYAF